MAVARHELALLLLPGNPDTPEETVERGWLGMEDQGWRSGELPGARPALESGSFLRAWFDGASSVRFAANRLGGFEVRCPSTAQNLVPGFVPAMTAWRVGGPRSLACPSCGHTHALEDLDFRRLAGFARGWIVLEEVEDLHVHEALLAFLAGIWGSVRMVWRRG